MADRAWLPIADLAAKVQTGELKATDLVRQSLERIAGANEYKSIIVTTESRALERAAKVDSRVAAGESAGRLAGVPFIAKDNFLVFGAETTAASNILKGFESPYQSTAIEKLEAEGKADQVKGHAKEALGDVKDAAHGARDSLKD